MSNANEPIFDTTPIVKKAGETLTGWFEGLSNKDKALYLETAARDITDEGAAKELRDIASVICMSEGIQYPPSKPMEHRPAYELVEEGMDAILKVVTLAEVLEHEQEALGQGQLATYAEIIGAHAHEAADALESLRFHPVIRASGEETTDEQ